MAYQPSAIDTTACPDLPPRAHRTVSLYLLARLRPGQGADGLCRVRNMSASGLMLETQEALAVGQIVTIEFRNATTVSGRVVWTANGRAGVHVNRQIDVHALLEDLSGRLQARAIVSRAPRFECGGNAKVRMQGHNLSAPLGNISMGGLLVDVPAAVDDIVIISIPGLPDRMGRVRWCRNGHCGVMLMEPYSFCAMTHWLSSQMRDPYGAGSAAPKALDERAGDERPAIDQDEEDDLHRQ